MACVVAAWAVLGVAATPARTALPPWPNQPPVPPVLEDRPRGFTLHWAGRTPLRGDEALARAVPINFGAAAVRQDVAVLRDGDLGRWPREGLHALIERPEALAEIVPTVAGAAAAVISQPDFDGLVVIDFRGWTPLWERYPPALQDQFRRALKRAHPEALQGLSAPQIESAAREAFDEVTRGLYSGALAALKQRWPKAKFSCAFVPPMIFGMDALLPKATMGYGETWPNPASVLNDRLAWLVDQTDFVTLTILPWAMSGVGGDKSDYRRGTIEPVLNWRYYASNVREAVRMARGKPVYALSATRYAQDWGKMTGRPPLVDVDLHQLLTAAVMDRAVRGLILAEELRSPGEVLAWEEDLSRRVWPAAELVAGQWGARVVPREEPLPTWPNVGNLARGGRTVPRGFEAGDEGKRFAPASPR